MFRVTIERYEFSVIIIPLSVPVFVDYFFGFSFTEFLLIFLAELVWWSHVLSVPACLGSSLSLLLFRMRALLDKVFLAAYSSHLGPLIYPAALSGLPVSVERSAVNLIFLPI